MAKPEKDRLIEHSYDGIQEYDNPMPRWWVTMFWATIIFIPIYMLDLGGLGVGPGRIVAYDKEMATFKAAHPDAVAPDTAALLATLADAHEVSEGKAIFTKNCSACHAPDGGGIIGPNLTDEYWIHGGKIEEIGATVVAGVAAKGMPTWGKILKPKEVNEVVAYVWTLRGTTPAKAKPPEGQLVPR